MCQSQSIEQYFPEAVAAAVKAGTPEASAVPLAVSSEVDATGNEIRETQERIPGRT